MNRNLWTIQLLSAITVISLSESANILGIFFINSRSHHSINQPLVKGLAARGHNVTIVSPFKSKSALPNYTEILVGEGLPTYVDSIPLNRTDELAGFVNYIKHTSAIEYATCRQFFELDYTRRVLKSEGKPFDLIIAEMYHSQCYNLLAHYLDIPTIAILPPSMMAAVDFMIGNPGNPSYIPQITSSHSTKMEFFERLTNALQYTILNVAHYTHFNSYMKLISEEYLNMTLPSMDSLHRRVALAFYNNHFSFISRPSVPNAIDIAGIHIREPKPLPTDIKTFIEDAENGVIFFSFGTTIKASSIHPDTLEVIKGVFSTIPQKVIWRTNELNFTDLPPNVKTGRWFPQRDILEHKNVRAFISHCGLLGILEAIHTGTPVIAIPFLFDQFQNTKILEDNEVAIRIDYNSMDKNILQNAITQIFHDTKYLKNMEKLSKIFKDRPKSPLDTALYWSEYVIRHNGAPHMRVQGANMPFYQHMLLDVILLVLLFSLLVIYICKYVIINMFSYFFISKKKYKRE